MKRLSFVIVLLVASTFLMFSCKNAAMKAGPSVRSEGAAVAVVDAFFMVDEVYYLDTEAYDSRANVFGSSSEAGRFTTWQMSKIEFLSSGTVKAYGYRNATVDGGSEDIEPFWTGQDLEEVFWSGTWREADNHVYLDASKVPVGGEANVDLKKGVKERGVVAMQSQLTAMYEILQVKGERAYALKLNKAEGFASMGGVFSDVLVLYKDVAGWEAGEGVFENE